MRKVLEAISARLHAFIEHFDDVGMVLRAAESDSLPLLTTIESIAAQRDSDLFWTFTEPFADATAYADRVVTAFKTKHDAVRLAMEKEGMQPWPPVPDDVLFAVTPALRLRGLAAFARDRLPVPGGGFVVWTFFPMEIRDDTAYAALMRDVLAHDLPVAWCYSLKFIVREDPRDEVLTRLLVRAPRVQHFAPDLTLETLNESIEDEVDDDSLPLPQRMGALLLAAGNDFAFHRLPEALEKYALVLQYHGSMGDHPMVALAMNCMGQIYERMGDLNQASAAYEAALVPASHGKYPTIPVFSNVVMSLANLRVTQQRWSEAEGYYDSLQQLATVARDVHLKIWALEQRGVCQQRQGKLRHADDSWIAGSVLAAQIQDAKLCANMLERRLGLHVSQGNLGVERELRGQLAALGRTPQL